MKKFKDKKELRKELTKLFSSEQYDDALSIIIRNQSLVQNDAQLLFDRGLTIHMSDSVDYSVKDVIDSYSQALDIDAGFLPPRMELAWTLLKVKNDAKKAMENFSYILDKLNVIPVIYMDAYEGFLSCVIELKGKNAARTHCHQNEVLLMSQKRQLWQKIMKSYSRHS